MVRANFKFPNSYSSVTFMQFVVWRGGGCRQHEHWWPGLHRASRRHRTLAFRLRLFFIIVYSYTLQVLTDVKAPLPSGAKLQNLLRRHEVGSKLIDYRRFLSATKYTRKSWRVGEPETLKGMKLKSFPRRPAPLFICYRRRTLRGRRQPHQKYPDWEPPYVELRLSDVRPINVERPGHVCSDDRAWYAHRYE